LSTEDKFDPKKFSEDIHGRIHQDIHDRFEEKMRRRMERRMARRDRAGSMWPGAILILVGTVILLGHMGIIEIDRVWRFWPVLIIAVAAVRFVDGCNRFSSAMVMLVGALFLLGNLHYLRFSWAELWPVVLIAAGLAMIWGRMNMPNLPTANSGSGGGPNKVTATAMFGGVERRIDMNNFTGGNISATFGGVELDFRGAEIEGEQAVLYVDALFGGIEIVVPERWSVVYEGQSIFGGYSDETRPALPDVPGAPARKRLILRGQAMFGGITVKN
jgi:predicted membrane protein